MEKRSRQRDAIYADLCSRKDHPTADMVYESVKKDFPSIGIATVYRNLRAMADSGKIRVLHTENADHFDADISNHCHLYCRNCKSLLDFEMISVDSLVAEAKDEYNSSVDSVTLIFNGLCEDCYKKAN